ncbi:MAG: serine/threonine protein kinase [Pirellulales bacterium]
MAFTSAKSVFQEAALLSGLVTREHITGAVAALRASDPAVSRNEPRTITDRQLADELVNQKRLNRWQAGQLLLGRSKFTLGPYQIVDSIGQGGMGQVFKAEHTVMGRTVAVKVLPRSRSTPEAIESFTREIRAQAQLDHENLVRAYDAGRDGNVYYLVTEYVPGTDLRKLIHRIGRLDMYTAATLISQVAKGLEHAHSRGLIHRDVKPGNVLVTPDGRAKISDLGLVSCLSENDGAASRSGKIVGTVDYLSPEQILAPRSLTPASDIYSLGCTMYYALTGKVPFPGGGTGDKAHAHCELQPLDPRRLNPQLDADFVDVLAHMMTKTPSERIRSAAEVVACLTPWVRDCAPLPMEGAAAPPADPFHRPTTMSLSGSGTLNDADTNAADFPEPEMEQGVSFSQVLQGTQPMDSAAEETLPMFLTRKRRRSRIGWPTMVLMGIAIVLAVAVLVLILTVEMLL